MSINEAIKKAKPGAIIIIPPGTYTGQIIITKPVVLKGS